ncbi:MAG: 2-oxo acid dehydrogenase subunit E2 [Ruminococcaceae bacterium]|nr:2-oxo acid dehydrogenase subunit E2 [Oscillospiraceae bacterium]
MRADGKRVKNVDPMYTLAPYFMRRRSDAQNAITVTVPYDNVHDYVLDARKKGIKLSHLTVVMAALVRTVSEFPELNRFVVNSKIYAHNELKIAMVVLRPSDNNPSMGKMKFDLYDTVFDVNDKIDAFINENNKSTSNTKVDQLFKTLVSCGPLMRFVLGTLRGLDKLGWLPKAVIDLTPFHGSLVFTNLASIRTNHIYHHVYDFGTMGMVVAMGNNIDAPKKKKGEIVLEKQIPFGIVMDERLADGHRYAQAFASIEKYLKNPTLLETPPESVKVDYEFEGLSERFKSEKTKQKEAIKAEKQRKKQEKREAKN